MSTKPCFEPGTATGAVPQMWPRQSWSCSIIWGAQSDGKEGPGVGIMRGTKGEERELQGCILKGLPLLPCGSSGKASACNAGDPGLISGSGRSPGEGNGIPIQYSCLEDSMDRGAWWATVHGVVKSRTRLSDLTTFYFPLLRDQLSSGIKVLGGEECSRPGRHTHEGPEPRLWHF